MLGSTGTSFRITRIMPHPIHVRPPSSLSAERGSASSFPRYDGPTFGTRSIRCQSLRSFLVDEKIVRPPLPAAPIGQPEAHIDVIVDVNRRLRHYWPGTAMVWLDGALRRVLKSGFKADDDLVASGGPLRYGLTAA